MGDDNQKVRDLKRDLEKKREELQDGFFADSAALRQVNSRIEQRRNLKGHFGKVYTLDWAGKGSDMLLSGSQDGQMIVWNANSGNKLHVVPLRSAYVMGCCFEKEENNLVASGGLDNVISIYKLDDNPAAPRSGLHKELVGHDGYISSCKFMGPSRVVSSSGDGSCRLWDVEKGVCLSYYYEHLSDVMCASPHPSSGDLFVSASVDGDCKLWDTRTAGKTKKRQKTNNRNKRYFGEEEELEGEIGSSVMTFMGHESDVNSVCFFPDGRAFGTGSDDATCKMFDMRCYQEVNTFRNQRLLCGITSVAFSLSGRIMFAGYDDYSCAGWDTLLNPSEATGESNPAVVLRKADNRVSGVSVHSQGKAVATANWDSVVRIYA